MKVIFSIVLILIVFIYAPIVPAAPPPVPTPTPIPTPNRVFSGMCTSVYFDGGQWQSRIQFAAYNITITGPSPACVLGIVETITISP